MVSNDCCKLGHTVLALVTDDDYCRGCSQRGAEVSEDAKKAVLCKYGIRRAVSHRLHRYRYDHKGRPPAYVLSGQTPQRILYNANPFLTHLNR